MMSCMGVGTSFAIFMSHGLVRRHTPSWVIEDGLIKEHLERCRQYQWGSIRKVSISGEPLPETWGPRRESSFLDSKRAIWRRQTDGSCGLGDSGTVTPQGGNKAVNALISLSPFTLWSLASASNLPPLTSTQRIWILTDAVYIGQPSGAHRSADKGARWTWSSQWKIPAHHCILGTQEPTTQITE